MIRTAHDIITLCDQAEDLFGIIDTQLCIEYAGFDDLRLRKIKKFSTFSHSITSADS